MAPLRLENPPSSTTTTAAAPAVDVDPLLGTPAPALFPIPPVLMAVTFTKERQTDKAGLGLGQTDGGRIMITSVREGGAAEYTSLQKGMEITTINGTSLRGKSWQDARDLVTNAVGTVTLHVVLPVVQSQQPRQRTNTAIHTQIGGTGRYQNLTYQQMCQDHFYIVERMIRYGKNEHWQPNDSADQRFTQWLQTTPEGKNLYWQYKE